MAPMREVAMRAQAGRDSANSTRSILVSLGALAAASLWPATAAAQVSGASTTQPQDQAAPAESSADADGTAIIVTGSRLARSTFDTPSPVTVLGAEEFDRLQITNVGEGVQELPAFRPST